MSKGWRISLSVTKHNIEVSTNTKVVANPMPVAELSCFETPIKGQIPKNRTNTKLFTIAALKKSKTYDIWYYQLKANWLASYHKSL